MARENHDFDPRGLIREAYAIDGISSVECRAIFFDWALTRADAPTAAVQISTLLESYGAAAPDHPMTAVLREGVPGMAAPQGRRGGRRGRSDGKP